MKRIFLCMIVFLSLIFVGNCFAANDGDANPIYLDTRGEQVIGYHAGRRDLYLAGVVIVASGDNWMVNLTEQDGGKTVFERKSAISNDRGDTFAPAEPVPFRGLYTETLDNIAQVLVYVIQK